MTVVLCEARPEVTMAAQEQPRSTEEVQDRIQALTEVNMQLCDKNEHLFSKLSLLESRVSRLSSSNTELSSKLLQSEEDKLKLSKEVIEQKTQINKMMEKFEEELMTLKDKLLHQGSVITQLEMERDRLRWDLQAAEGRLAADRDLSQDYTQLQDNYQSLIQAHHRERGHNEELSTELLALAQAQDALRRQVQEQQQTVQTTTKDLHTELERVRTIVSRMSQERVKPEDLAALDKEQKTLGENLLGNQDEIKTMMENLKRTYTEQQKTLEDKVSALDKEHKERKMEIQSPQQTLTQHNTSQTREMEEENSRLQLRLKELNEEYRSRLNRYIQDLAEYMDGLESRQSPDGGQMKKYVDNMLQDMRSSFRAREEQLATAARVYKKRLQRITNTHHALLIAYRAQREQILGKAELGLNAGPSEASFSLDLIELKTETEKELQRLREDKARLELTLQTSKGQVQALHIPIQAVSPEAPQSCGESRADRDKHQKDITGSTLAGFEKERALLMTRATVAEAQVSELQEYINNQLSRCKDKSTCRSDGADKAQQSTSAS